MFACYIHEVSLMDQEVLSVLRKRPTIKPSSKNQNPNKMRLGVIDKQYMTVMFTRREVDKFVFALDNKHLFSTTCLEHIVELVNRCKQNSVSDKKYFMDMLWWFITFRQTILAISPSVYKTVKKTSAAKPK